MNKETILNLIEKKEDYKKLEIKFNEGAFLNAFNLKHEKAEEFYFTDEYIKIGHKIMPYSSILFIYAVPKQN